MDEASLLADKNYAQARLVRVEDKLEKCSGEEERKSLLRSYEILVKQIAELTTALLVEKERARLQGASVAGGPGSSGSQGAPAGAIEDVSELLAPRFTAIPETKALRAALGNFDGIQLPLSAYALSVVRSELGSKPVFAALLSAVREGPGGPVESALSTAVTHRYREPKTEQDVAMWVNTIFISVLQAFDDALAGQEEQVKFEVTRNLGDRVSGATMLGETGATLRTDINVFSANDQLMLKGEEKLKRILDAIFDLEAKTAMWSPIMYGLLDYIPCFAAAGASFQVLVVSRDGASTNVSEQFDVSTVAGRLKLLCMTVNMYSLLRCIKNEMPAYVLPVGKTQFRSNPEALWTCGITFNSDLSIVKVIRPWSSYVQEFAGMVDLDTLKRIYGHVQGARGIIQATRGPSLSQGGAYVVNLKSAGLRGADILPR